MGDHDVLFKRAFRVPAHAAGELLAVLPKNLLDVVDLDSIALAETDITTAELGELFADALFSVNFRGVPGYVWFLVEHQSEPDRFMVLRALNYLTQAWINLVDAKKPDTLPPVVCVVVHHGSGGWNAPTSLRDLIGGLDQALELERLAPTFEIIVDDLGRQPDEELKRRPLPLFPKVVLWVLRDARVVKRLYQHLAAWVGELDRLSRETPADATTVMRYILKVAGDEPFENIKKRIVELVPAAEDVMATAAEQLIQEGVRRGEARGRAEGMAQSILAVLEGRKFSVTDEERDRILSSTDIAELDRWIKKAVVVRTVAELFSH